MAFIIETDNDGLITLTLPNDVALQSKDIEEILEMIRTYMNMEDKDETLGKLFGL